MQQDYPVSEVVFNNLLRWLRAYGLEWSGEGLSPLEAGMWCTGLDLWHRYNSILHVLRAELQPGVKILEVGAGWFGFEFFLPRDLRKESLLVQIDIRHRPIRVRVGSEERLIASAGSLPFKRSSFDYVLAMDVLEHIPRARRGDFCGDLKRVASKAVILHSPIQDDDGTYRAREYDEMFLERLSEVYGLRDGNTEEHLRHGEPTPEELSRYFPGSSLMGTQNADDWLSRVLKSRRPLPGLFRALQVSLRSPPVLPPYYSGLMVWRPPG